MKNSEQDPRAFLMLIVQTISVLLIWMIANVFIGIYLGYGFFETAPDWQNYIYYFLFLATFILLVKHIIKKWNA